MKVLTVGLKDLEAQLQAVMKIQGHWWTKPYQLELEGLENFISELNAALRDQGDTMCRPIEQKED